MQRKWFESVYSKLLTEAASLCTVKLRSASGGGIAKGEFLFHSTRPFRCNYITRAHKQNWFLQSKYVLLTLMLKMGMRGACVAQSLERPTPDLSSGLDLRNWYAQLTEVLQEPQWGIFNVWPFSHEYHYLTAVFSVLNKRKMLWGPSWYSSPQRMW